MEGLGVNEANQLDDEGRYIDPDSFVALRQIVVEPDRQRLVTIPKHLLKVVDDRFLGEVHVHQILHHLQLREGLRVDRQLEELKLEGAQLLHIDMRAQIVILIAALLVLLNLLVLLLEHAAVIGYLLL